MVQWQYLFSGSVAISFEGLKAIFNYVEMAIFFHVHMAIFFYVARLIFFHGPMAIFVFSQVMDSDPFCQ